MPKLAPGAKPGDFPPDCEFYRWAWQTFLYSTDAGKKRPRLLEYATFRDVFNISHSPLFADAKTGQLALAPRTVEHANKEDTSATQISDLEQANSERVLIDRNGNPIFYQIHVNPIFVEFVKANDLTNIDVLKAIASGLPDLRFRAGSVEFKSAWQIIEKPSSDFITADAVVPIFKKDNNGNVVRDGTKTRNVKVALVGLHVVGVIDGHPEFIWATFEHTSQLKNSSGNRVRDVAPSAKAPPGGNQSVVTEGNKYLLYPGQSKSEAPAVPNANIGDRLKDLALDVKTQKFSPPSAIYRMYPASKQPGVGDNGDGTQEDDSVTSINKHIQDAFDKLGTKDARSNYSLVGAVWLNNPFADFRADNNFPPVDDQGKPLPTFKGFGGEDALSSMGMESFTQQEFPNCFSCHDTSKAGTKSPKLGSSLLNVSHVLSKYYDLTKK
jgi:hypothetical protein